MLADNVYSAWGTGDELGRVAVCSLEASQKVVPSFRFSWDSIRGIDLCQRADDGDIVRHFERSYVTAALCLKSTAMLSRSCKMKIDLCYENQHITPCLDRMKANLRKSRKRKEGYYEVL